MTAALQERILCLVKHILWLVKADFLYIHTDELKYLVNGPAVMAEGYRAMVGEILLNKYMSVEAAHLWNCKDADGSKGSGGYRKHLALGNVSPQPTVCCALKAVKGDVSGNNIALQSTLGYFLR